MSQNSSAIICTLLATTAGIESAIYIGTWFGLACIVIALAFGVVAGLLFRASA